MKINYRGITMKTLNCGDAITVMPVIFHTSFMTGIKMGVYLYHDIHERDIWSMGKEM
jgi:hypothetical protein